ncbi:hypothetical protein PPERSA_01651 [Pseudocohnilembus persalinus]|uniref:Uncharacterized protein n=1 Tax=Pseudocohnilembus persalinus TaxID=266149 RepID=A0A0V0R1D3_PSEPJ|nr:hypothetical protein PPERSA_01651 [Pseudocohnilembus persalinus]|eukprot:KRX08106.1 hypothetical protein PPERSA_01651 [Pseudocohnilembus persalinus]
MQETETKITVYYIAKATFKKPSSGTINEFQQKSFKVIKEFNSEQEKNQQKIIILLNTQKKKSPNQDIFLIFGLFEDKIEQKQDDNQQKLYLFESLKNFLLENGLEKEIIFKKESIEILDNNTNYFNKDRDNDQQQNNRYKKEEFEKKLEYNFCLKFELNVIIDQNQLWKVILDFLKQNKDLQQQIEFNDKMQAQNFITRNQNNSNDYEFKFMFKFKKVIQFKQNQYENFLNLILIRISAYLQSQFIDYNFSKEFSIEEIYDPSDIGYQSFAQDIDEIKQIFSEDIKYSFYEEKQEPSTNQSLNQQDGGYSDVLSIINDSVLIQIQSIINL